MLEKLRIKRDEVKSTGQKKEEKKPKSKIEKTDKHKSPEQAFYDNGAKKLTSNNKIQEQNYIEKDVKRGLRNANGTGVVVGLTHIGEVVGYEKDEKGNKVPLEGKLFYRGYDVEDLVNNVLLEDRFGFEEIAYLLLMGELPTKKELAAYNDLIGEHRELPMGFARDMILTAPSKNIMNKLARSVLALYSFDDNPDDISLPNVLRQSMNLMGYFPAIICYAYQAKSSYYDKKSLHLHDPIRELSTSENILRMLRPMGEYSDDAPDFVHWHRYVFGDRGCGRFAQRPKTRWREHRGNQYDQ